MNIELLTEFLHEFLRYKDVEINSLNSEIENLRYELDHLDPTLSEIYDISERIAELENFSY